MKKKTFFSLYPFLFLCIFILTITLFQKSFSVFFFQDDFFLFAVSRYHNIADILKALIPRSDAIHFCPISQEFFYAIFYKIFGLNTLPYHLFQFAIHFANAFLFFLLVKQIFKQKLLAFLSSFFYTVSWTHFYELVWIGATFNSIGVFFILIFLIFSIKKNSIYLKFTPVILVMSILSLETAVVSPLLALLIQFFTKKLKKDQIKIFLLNVLIVCLYVFYRFVIFKIPATDSYQITLSIKALKNLAVFILWFFNFPEASIVHFKPNLYLLTLTDSWFSETFSYYAIFLTLSLLFFLFFIILNIALLLKDNKKNKDIFLGIIWFLIALVPVLIIPKRVYPYYPIVAQIGFWIFLSNLIIKTKFKTIGLFFVLLFLLGTIFAVNFNFKNHWILASSGAAKDYYEKFNKINKAFDKRTEIYWQIDDTTSQNALLNGLAFNVFLNNYAKKFYLSSQNLSPKKQKTIFNLHEFLLQERTDRLEKYFKNGVATPSAALDLWYQE